MGNVSAQMSSPVVLDIGSRRELFADHFLIHRLDNLTLKLHEPRDEGVALQLNRPWEAPYPCYFTVIKDGDLYRMYYRGRTEVSGGGGPSASACYAESSDGINWRRPDIGLIEVTGTLKNNVIMAREFSGNFSPLLDTRPGLPSSERYKALSGSPPTAFVSGDGIRWNKLREEPVMSHDGPAWDSQNVAFWSESEQCYVAYVRTFKLMGETQEASREEYRRRFGVDCYGWRWVSRATSEDFVTWTDLEEMDCGNRPNEELYTNGTHPYFRAPHIYVALSKRFLPGKPALTPEEAEALTPDPGHRMDSSDSVFMTTRGGNRYDRTFMEAFIRPGPSPRDWVARDNTPALGVVPGGPRQMFLYRLSHYGQPTVHLTRYSLRLDGFVSVNAGYFGGQLVTRPFRFTGRELEVNYATSAAGGVRVELQDAHGTAFPGYRLDQCPQFIGDEVDRVVRWKHGTDVGPLEGKVVRLCFELMDADLYSIRFRGMHT